MASVLRHGLKKVLQVSHRCMTQTHTGCGRTGSAGLLSAKHYSLYEPDDLGGEPEIPEYDTLDIQMRGYDYVVLESFAKYVHKLATSLALDTDAWAVPARTSTVNIFKLNSINVDSSYQLALYERIVQVQDLPSTMAPLLLEVIQLHLPEGVEFTAKEHDPEEDEFRYVPDLMLMDLQAKISEIDKAREERKKK